MRISVITPTLRGGADLDMAVASVRAQTHTDIEHIIVSADPEVKAGGARVTHPPPRGVYDALNRGFAAATGEVVGLLHAGDTFASADVLARVARAFDTHALDYIWGDIQYVSGADRRPGRRYSGSAGLSATLLARGLQPPHPSLFMRREALAAVGPYDTAERVCADFDMWVRIAGDTRLRGAYSGILTTMMSLGGLSTRPGARLWRNNLAKLRILRAHGLPASPLRLAARYIYILRDYARR